jgi:hypothetical protein
VSEHRPVSTWWPLPLRLHPGTIVVAMVAVLAVAWTAMLVVDVLGWVTIPGAEPLWMHLFNNRPVEWVQWLLLGWAILQAGFVAGRLPDDERRLRGFVLLLGAGLVLMLFEDAGDARHVLSDYVEAALGSTILGLPHRVVADVPYFAVIAILPMLAVLRFGRDAWRSPTARRYLLLAYGLYAVAAIGSGLRHLGGLYMRVGGALDRLLLAGRFPPPDGGSRWEAAFWLMDSVVEETIESVAAAAMLAVMLAIAHDLRAGRLRPRADRPA